MKSVTTKFAVASIYILFTVLLISGASVKYSRADTACKILNPEDECPCNYSAVPKNPECWGDSMHSTGNNVFQPCLVGGQDCPSLTDSCSLYRINLFNGSANDMSVYAKPLGGTDHYVKMCSVRIQSTKGCSAGANQSHQLTDAQATTCLCRLAEYANNLADADIVIESIQNPSYSCESIP